MLSLNGSYLRLKIVSIAWDLLGNRDQDQIRSSDSECGFLLLRSSFGV